MRNNRFALYLHLVWATRDRNPLIMPRYEKAIYQCIVNQVKKQGCDVIAINGVCDHIHLLIKYSSTATIAKIVKQAKGVSSRFINKYLDVDDFFRWQMGYEAFAVSRWDLPIIVNYVRKQKKHHREDKLYCDLETIFDGKNVPEEGRLA